MGRDTSRKQTVSRSKLPRLGRFLSCYAQPRDPRAHADLRVAQHAWLHITGRSELDEYKIQAMTSSEFAHEIIDFATYLAQQPTLAGNSVQQYVLTMRRYASLFLDIAFSAATHPAQHHRLKRLLANIVRWKISEKGQRPRNPIPLPFLDDPATFCGIRMWKRAIRQPLRGCSQSLAGRAISSLHPNTTQTATYALGICNNPWGAANR